MRIQRQVVQIIQLDEGFDERMAVLCHDGTIWLNDVYGNWKQLPTFNIPCITDSPEPVPTPRESA